MKNALQVFGPDMSQWDAWRPEQAARVLEGVDVPWYVAGGWAIDLFLGGQRREHGDLEIAVPRDRVDEVAGALTEFEICVITGPGEAMLLAFARDQLDTTHQTWVREPATGLWRIDIFREPSEGDVWIYRRDRSIRLPYAQVIERTDDGVPYGRPEIALLYKAKHADRARDRDDFAAVLPWLEPKRRRWLVEALEIVHPGHPWLRELEGIRP